MSLKSVMEYPDISFIDNLTQEDLLDKMIAWFLEKRKELTGKDISLGYADDRRLILQTGAYYIYQAFMMTDNAGKMGLLKYATGDYLEELGALKGVSRLQERGSTVTLRYSMETARESATSVPAGSRATAGDGDPCRKSLCGRDGILQKDRQRYKCICSRRDYKDGSTSTFH